jgi:hypothetical protein
MASSACIVARADACGPKSLMRRFH